MIPHFLWTDMVSIKLGEINNINQRTQQNIHIYQTVHWIPISFYIDKGSEHDLTILLKYFDDILIDTKTNQYKNHNRYCQYILADKGYDSSILKNKFKEKGYKILIPQNKRNTKNRKK